MMTAEEMRALYAKPAPSAPAAEQLPAASVRPMPDPAVRGEPLASARGLSEDGVLAAQLQNLTAKALKVQDEILDMPYDAEPNKAVLGAKALTANNVSRLQASVEEAKFRKRQEDVLPMLLARLAEARRSQI
jgi:hypothetical protein